jgi:biopolymer transport protein ExbD
MRIKRRKLDAGVPSVAMADIAFNLVLFFIILARTQDESHLKLNYASAPALETISNSKVSVKVVTADKKAQSDGRQQIYLNGKEVGVRELTAKIQELLKDDPPGKRTVLLKIDKDTQAALFEPIMEAVSQAGGDVVHVLAEEKK